MGDRKSLLALNYNLRNDLPFISTLEGKIVLIEQTQSLSMCELFDMATADFITSQYIARTAMKCFCLHQTEFFNYLCLFWVNEAII